MAFPNPNILSAFTGVDENPLSESAAWSGPTEAGQPQLQRLSNQAAAVGSFAGSHRASPSLADIEVYCDVPVLPTSTKGVSLRARIQNAGNTTTMTCYHWTYVVGTGFQWYKVTAGHTFTQIGTTFAPHVLLAGEQLGMSVVGTTISGYYGVAGVWTLVDSRTDASIGGAGLIGASLDDTTGRIDNFGGGAPAAGGTILAPSASMLLLGV